MSGVEIRQSAASEGQRGSRRGQEGWPAPLYMASWSTVLYRDAMSVDVSKKRNDHGFSLFLIILAFYTW